MKDCSQLPDGSKYTYCRKIEQDIPAHAGGESLRYRFNFRFCNVFFKLFFCLENTHTRIIRQCGYYNVTAVLNEAGCYKAGLINGGRQIICICSEDGCNGSSHLRQMSIANLFAVVTLVISLGYKMNYC